MYIGRLSVTIMRLYTAHVSYYEGRVRQEYTARGFCEFFYKQGEYRYRDLYVTFYNTENTFCGRYIGTLRNVVAAPFKKPKPDGVATARDMNLVYASIFCSSAMIDEVRHKSTLLHKYEDSDPHLFSFEIEHKPSNQLFGGILILYNVFGDPERDVSNKRGAIGNFYFHRPERSVRGEHRLITELNSMSCSSVKAQNGRVFNYLVYNIEKLILMAEKEGIKDEIDYMVSLYRRYIPQFTGNYKEMWFYEVKESFDKVIRDYDSKFVSNTN
jgi:hypothetical protein